MKKENLTELILNHFFDDYRKGLSSRFYKNRIGFDHHYENTDSKNSVIVELKKNGIDSRIELNDSGILSFNYSKESKNHSERFKNCSTDDFHTMLAHAFIYLKDGNFDYHKEWYESLKRI
ncbi:hypothetical protein [Aquimarina sp. 2201CG14-23]|uniref:hypothetical protein n=1 Tax=Aquimarina mycalae TaxID=3040073 RepID=UPI0024781F6E|nr:hypothetical protein [Aquimarina sp. 2201CG14-23]MDH7448478.1 hypothetical protein [Aquimarina sp. 2201CG14-23]